MANRSHRNSGCRAMNAMNRSGATHSSVRDLNIGMPGLTHHVTEVSDCGELLGNGTG